MFFANILEITIAMKNESIPLRIIKARIVKTFGGEIVFRSSFTAAAEPVLVFSIE